MSIDLLDTPLRITWDLWTPAAASSAANALAIAERLVEAQVFFATLETAPLRHPEVTAVVQRLAAAGCQLLLVCRGSREEIEAASGLPDGVTLLLEIEPFVVAGELDLYRLSACCAELNQVANNFGLSLVPKRDHLELIGPLLRFCLEQDIPRFKLPNMRIDASFSPGDPQRTVSPQDVERFRQLAADFPDFRQRLQLDVHDLFLWEILFPDGGTARSEYGGCQAANSLAHVDVDGTVHPCVSWPQPLGSLRDSSFYDIWASPARLAVRDEIASVPAGCAGCRDYSLCFAGCRGLSRLDPSLDGRDPMCGGVR